MSGPEAPPLVPGIAAIETRLEGGAVRVELVVWDWASRPTDGWQVLAQALADELARGLAAEGEVLRG